jgi:hypothetical protein
MAEINIYKPTDSVTAEIVHGIINATGRTITIVATSGLMQCPTCSGTNAFCGTCNGNPTVDALYTVAAIAGVRWKGGEVRRYSPQAQTIAGDCQVVLILDTTIEATLQQARYIMVDNRRCVVDGWHLDGAPPNRVLVTLNEDENLNGPRAG